MTRPVRLAPSRRPGALWAWTLAEQHLATALPRRWAHVQGVARTGRRVGRTVLRGADRDLLVAAALLHDIGYAPALVRTGYHPLDGARFLASVEPDDHLPRLTNLVANHSAARLIGEVMGLGDVLATFPDEQTPLRDALWYCDMHTSPAGEPTTFAQRVADIRLRHGPGSPLVRALDAGALDARWEAVCRTELRLRAAAVRDQV